MMEVLMAPEECRSGCGIYAGGVEAKGNIITGNLIRNVRDCGIYGGVEIGIVKDNIVESYEGTIESGCAQNVELTNRLREERIRSIYG